MPSQAEMIQLRLLERAVKELENIAKAQKEIAVALERIAPSEVVNIRVNE